TPISSSSLSRSSPSRHRSAARPASTGPGGSWSARPPAANPPPSPRDRSHRPALNTSVAAGWVGGSGSSASHGVALASLASSHAMMSSGSESPSSHAGDPLASSSGHGGGAGGSSSHGSPARLLPSADQGSSGDWPGRGRGVVAGTRAHLLRSRNT